MISSYFQTKSNLYMTHHETAMSIWEERPEAKLLWKKIVQEMSKENIVKSSPLYYEIKNNRKLKIAVGLRTSEYKSDDSSDLLKERNASEIEIEAIEEIAEQNKDCIFLLMNRIHRINMPDNSIDISTREFKYESLLWNECDGYIGSSSGITIPFILQEKPCYLLSDCMLYPEPITRRKNVRMYKRVREDFYHPRDRER